MATSSRALLVAFLAVVAAFIAATVWAQHAARGIDADALLISREAAPGIEALSSLRAELRSLELQTIQALDTRDDSLVSKARATVDALIGKALALPGDPYEKNQLDLLQADVRAFDEAAERAMAEARAGQAHAARDTLLRQARPQGDAAVAIAQDLVDYDARVAEKAAMHIEEERTRANRVAYKLDALCALLALAAALLALRVVRHVHSVQEAHRHLVEAKVDELEQFAGRVAHDVLSPLTSVGLALTVAARIAPAAHEAVASGNSALQRVRGLVDGLFEFARAGARPDALARTEVGPVVAGLRDELQPFAAECAAVLRLEPPPRCSVPCSPGVLLSLLGNLLRNAIKYLGPAQVREVSLRVRLRRGRVLFEVEDTGPGIPAPLTERIFEPYVRGSNSDVPGMGLGLATVKRLVVSHGGTVGVRAGAEGGALFWFELPEAPGVENVARANEEVHAGNS
jgi:signal transduction histidine kinase